jgi:ATP-dependent Lon protease
MEEKKRVKKQNTAKKIKSPDPKQTQCIEENLEQNLSENTNIISSVKLIPVNNTVLFPQNLLPLSFQKDPSQEFLEKFLQKGEKICILARKDPEREDFSQENFYSVGTLAKVIKMIHFSDDTFAVLVQGLHRVKILNFLETPEAEDPKRLYLTASVQNFPSNLIANNPANNEQSEHSLQISAFVKAVKQLVYKAITFSPDVPKGAKVFFDTIQEPALMADLIAPYLSIGFHEKQALLELSDLLQILEKTHLFLVQEIKILEMSQKINSEVKTELGKQQRKYIVREQMKILQKELGEIEGKNHHSYAGNDPSELKEKVLESDMTSEARDAALREIDRMHLMQSNGAGGSSEFIVSHTYVSWLLDIPWKKASPHSVSLDDAQNILDAEHHGLLKVKKRILEHLAVSQLKKSLQGPILLFVGPPGVGKTSLGKSIAKALNRKFVKIALGGVRDEAEIRGHRRTYIGSMPGKIVDALKKAGSSDPVILLDEIDKISNDQQRGDPASALLEILDPEQNQAFVDHYLNVPLDLSQVFFIATANNVHLLPPPLRDRMEVIDLNSYTMEEKERIAFEYLLPQVVQENGLHGLLQLNMTSKTMCALIQHYTREAGVRQLKRELSSIVRNLARNFLEKNLTTLNKNMDFSEIRKILGPYPFVSKKKPPTLPVGVATGLAWTPNGGDILYIETAASSPGTGKFGLTGQLGEVMKESVQTAFAYIRSHARTCGVENKSVVKKDLHVHFPEGAVKKDGPSAGIATFLGIVSQLTGKPLASDLAMTGEISLRGEILPVGGIKEKLLAAHRYGIKQVLIPQHNTHELEEIPKEVLKKLKVVPVSHLNEALDIAFQKTKKTVSRSYK